MRPDELALVLASDVAGSGHETFPLDRIRMQKAAFLVSKRGTEQLRDLYTYEPYNWGPYSSSLTSDLRRLTATELLKLEGAPNSQYGRYVTTTAGEKRAQAVWETLSENEHVFLRSVRQFVTTRSFSRLLRDVYAAYPDYATRSRFNG